MKPTFPLVLLVALRLGDQTITLALKDGDKAKAPALIVSDFLPAISAAAL